MSAVAAIRFLDTDLDSMATFEGRVAILVSPDGKLGPAGRRANRLTKGAVQRLLDSDAFDKLSSGKTVSLAWPTGMAAEALDILVLGRRASAVEARKAGANLGKLKGRKPLQLMAGNHSKITEIAFGAQLRAYAFTEHKTGSDAGDEMHGIEVHVTKPDEAEVAFAPLQAVAEGAFFTRDLTNEPANVLTTTEFANRLDAMREIGLEVEVLEEDQLAELGMRTLLSEDQKLWTQGLQLDTDQIH